MPLLHDFSGGIMTTLFDLAQYDVIPTKREIDPYWDELVLDCSGRVEDNGQTTLFYDASDEPPDPDDFQDRNDFEVAWSDWEKQHPDFKPAMSPFPEQTDEDFMDVLEDLPTLPEQNINFDNLPEQNNCVLEKSKQFAQWTEKYSVNRGSKRHWYFRYCYYWFGKIHHIHIPGGNTNSAIALDRVERVRSAIANAASPTEIQNLIRGGFQN
jgi:hypothetical protein